MVFLVQHVVFQGGFIPLSVDKATPTPELSRHLAESERCVQWLSHLNLMSQTSLANFP